MHLERTLTALANASPQRLYISIDGPRDEHPEDMDAVAATVQVAKDFSRDFPSSLLTSTTNGGVGAGVLRGLDWFFDQVPRGIVIEDDVCIQAGSLQLAGLLLQRFEDDESVGSVTLFNAVPKSRIGMPSSTVRFSNLASSQYWGTWGNRWQRRMRADSDWRSAAPQTTLTRVGGTRFAHHWSTTMEAAEANGSVSWEHLWLMTHWEAGWCVANTNDNFSVHEGFDREAYQFT